MAKRTTPRRTGRPHRGARGHGPPSPTTDVPEKVTSEPGDRTFDDLQALLTARFVHSGDEIVTIDEDGTRLVREPAVADGGLKLAEAIEKKPELLGKLAEAALADAQKHDGRGSSPAASGG